MTELDFKTFCFFRMEKEHEAIISELVFGDAFDNYIR